MGQPVAFFEIISPDHERAQKFYRELFGARPRSCRAAARQDPGSLQAPAGAPHPAGAQGSARASEQPERLGAVAHQEVLGMARWNQCLSSRTCRLPECN